METSLKIMKTFIILLLNADKQLWCRGKVEKDVVCTHSRLQNHHTQAVVSDLERLLLV